MRIPIEITRSETPRYGMRYPCYEGPSHIFVGNDFTDEPLRISSSGGDGGGAGPSRSKKSESQREKQENQEEKPRGDGSHEPVHMNGKQTDNLVSEDENVDWRDRYQRLRADFDNYRKNADKERQKLVGFGKEALLEDIFPVVEHMERALEAARDMQAPAGMLEGIELVYGELTRAMERHGVERVKTVGEPFDPQIHEAVSVTNEDRYAEDTVVDEVRPGFLKDGKLLRPAAVIVSKHLGQDPGPEENSCEESKRIHG